MKFFIYHADCVGDTQNCTYPHKVEVTDAASLKLAVSSDHVCAQYLNSYRNKANFISSNCLVFDCDNDHSDNCADWVTPDDVHVAFPGVSFAIHYSRYHMISKDGKSARPQFHVFFPISPIQDATSFKTMKQKVCNYFPFFDRNALDAARFFFGTPTPTVAFFEHNKTITAFLANAQNSNSSVMHVIPESSRIEYLGTFAMRLLQQYGNPQNSYITFQNEAQKCVPLLSPNELQGIWDNATGFYKKICVLPHHTPLATSYHPSDYTHVGQAVILKNHFSHVLRYSDATHYIHYDGTIWRESNIDAHAVMHTLTDNQLQEALREYEKLMQQHANQTEEGKALIKKNEEYRQFSKSSRSSSFITATLNEAKCMLKFDPAVLNSNPFLLCTPTATYDLRDGITSAKAHDSADFITKTTLVSPSTNGADLWEKTVNQIFCGDQELITYVQCICGLAAIGEMYLEALIIAYGSGCNGKSTFWNTISHVLGTYSGYISADVLTRNCRRNIKPELAEVNGKRLLIAAEMQQGCQLNDSMLKQLCSTDDITGEKKFMAPVTFKPRHTLVLSTNHLPTVSASDDGTWRRLIVIPFQGKFESKDIYQNYSNYLVKNAGESVLKWIIEGAQMAHAYDYKLSPPPCVESAIAMYRHQNDWFGKFLCSQCEVGTTYMENSSALYSGYLKYCNDTGEPKVSTTNFYAALRNAKFNTIVQQRIKKIIGLRLRTYDAPNTSF